MSVRYLLILKVCKRRVGNDLVHHELVSFAAVIRVVTQRSSPLTERCVTTLITVAKETNHELAWKQSFLFPL